MSRDGEVWASNQLMTFDTRSSRWAASDGELNAVTCVWRDERPCVFRHSMVFHQNQLVLFGGQQMKDPSQPSLYLLNNAIVRYNLLTGVSTIAFASDCKSVLAPECRAAHSVRLPARMAVLDLLLKGKF